MITRNQLLAFLGAFFIAAILIGILVVTAARWSGTTIINVQPQPTIVATPAPCDLSKYNNLGIVIPPMEPNTMQTLPFPGGSVTLKCGSQGGEVTGSVTFSPTAAPIAPTALAVFCSWDGRTFLVGDNWTINGEPSTCISVNGVGGWKPISNAPATAVPTLAATSTPAPLAPTATPVPPGAGYCVLPDPAGYGNPGAWQIPGTKANVESQYTCDSALTGRWIQP